MASKKWTKEEDELLTELYKNNKPIKDMVSILNRSEKAIRSRIFITKLNEKYPRGKIHEDLIGRRYGMLIVLEKHSVSKYGSIIWKCICDCQLDKPEEQRKYTYVTTSNLNNGKTNSCGCIKRKHLDVLHKINEKINIYKVWNDITFVKFSNCDEWFIIDTEDFYKICRYCWSKNSYGYAVAWDKNGKAIKMHRLITNIPDNVVVDHAIQVSLGVLDNRKKNLIVCTQEENMKNRKVSNTNKTGVTGVQKYYLKKKWTGKWRVQISINNKPVGLGYYTNFDEAVKIRLQAEHDYYGIFSPQRHLFSEYGIDDSDLDYLAATFANPEVQKKYGYKPSPLPTKEDIKKYSQSLANNLN